MSAAPVFVRLEGGLGNRLFQDAPGRSLALAAGRDLLLDTSAYREDRLRAYQIDHFAIAARPLRRGDLPFFRLRRSRGSDPSRPLSLGNRPRGVSRAAAGLAGG